MHAFHEPHVNHMHHIKVFTDQASDPCSSAQGRHFVMSSSSHSPSPPREESPQPVHEDDVKISTQVQVKSSAYVWYPETRQEGGKSWVRLTKWDRGFVKFCLGAPMSTRRGQRLFRNVCFIHF